VNNPAAASGSPTVAGGVVYSNTSNGILSAFDTSAPDSNCTGTAPARICTPTWSTGIGYSYATPTIANGVLYGTGFNASTLQAIDTSGHLLWTTLGGATTYNSSPTVANGVVYVSNHTQTLTAYNATATAACTGTPLTCPPLYTSATAGAVFTPTVADGIVYGANNTSTKLTAFRLP
jgi:outer membrane protein assembly factor BamB